MYAEEQRDRLVQNKMSIFHVSPSHCILFCVNVGSYVHSEP